MGAIANGGFHWYKFQVDRGELFVNFEAHRDIIK